MRVILFLLFVHYSFAVHSQDVMIRGMVKDAMDGNPLIYATVAQKDAGTEIIAGVTTDEQGRFSLAVSSGISVRIRVQYIGYEQLDTTLHPDKLRQKDDVVFCLTPNVNKLTEVTVTAEKNAVNSGMDKQSFNARQLGNTTSGTGLDVLQRLPSVTVNTEGKILMRGNAEFLVTVNGKFTNQSAADILALLPANSIESIEIISAPSASMDAEGKAGIINIVTRTDIDRGWGIVLNSGLSSIRPDRYNADLLLHKAAGKFNAFISGNYRIYNIGGYRKGVIRTIHQDTLTYSPSGGIRPTREQVYGMRTGLSYHPDKSSSLSTGIYYGYKQNDRTAILDYHQYFSVLEPLDLNADFSGISPERSFLNSNLFIRTGKFFTATTDYSKTFRNKSKLSLSAIYEHSVLGGPLSNKDEDNNTGALTLLERSDEVSPLDAWRVQADYAFQIFGNMNMETGLQWRTVHHKGEFSFERQNLSSGLWERDPEFNDRLDLRQNVSAAYTQVNGKIGKTDFRAGLRAEHTYRTLTHLLGDRPFTLDQWDIFPSLQLYRKLSHGRSLRLGYSKRIDRPTTKALAPFKNHRHSEAIWIGDPDLKPEISHNMELGFVKVMDKISFSTTLYHNRTQNLIFRVNDSYNRITLFTISTNAGNSHATGMECTADWMLHPVLRIYLSGNVYNFQLYNLQNTTVSDRSSINYNINTNISWKLLNRLKTEWSVNYLSRTVTAQGFDTRLLLSNIALKYPVNKSLTLDLIWQNIFNTNVQTIYTSNPVFISSTEYSKYDRILILNLSYKFNDAGKNQKTIKTEYGEKDF
jgi:outer membrane receptor protein involved in Fe transport